MKVTAATRPRVHSVPATTICFPAQNMTDASTSLDSPDRQRRQRSSLVYSALRERDCGSIINVPASRVVKLSPENHLLAGYAWESDSVQ